MDLSTSGMGNQPRDKLLPGGQKETAWTQGITLAKEPDRDRTR